MSSMTRRYTETLGVSQRAKFTRDFSKAYRGRYLLSTELTTLLLLFIVAPDTDSNPQDWENVKYNNLKFSLPRPAQLTGYARQAELYLKHGILK